MAINVSVISEYFDSFFNKDEIKKWFWGFEKYAFIVDYFDDDFLQIDIFFKNKFLTPLITGLYVNYDKVYSEFSASEIQKFLN